MGGGSRPKPVVIPLFRGIDLNEEGTSPELYLSKCLVVIPLFRGIDLNPDHWDREDIANYLRANMS